MAVTAKAGMTKMMLLIKDEQGQEMIVMGKGLAFKGKIV
ncbi:MAG: CAT RNA binding domain-containing protein [Paenibacillus sp.]